MPGKSHLGPDAASRHPANTERKVECEKEEDVCSSHHACCHLLVGTDPDVTINEFEAALSTMMHASTCEDERPAVTWNVVKKAASTDEECVQLSHIIQDGFPEERGEVPEILRHFWAMREHLYTIQGVPFRDHKMLIPRCLRKQIIENLHEGHQGINSMLANARERFFWPGLDAQLRQAKNQCRRCNEIAPS